MSFIKRSIALLLVLAFCLSVSACAKKAEPAPEPTAEPTAEPVPTEEPVPADVAARLGDYTVSVSEIANEYDYFISYMSYYGLQAPEDPAEISQYVEMIVDSKISDLSLPWQADKMGITLTPEAEAEVEAEVQAHRDDIEANYRTTAAEQLGEEATEEEIASKAQELIDADVKDYMGYDYETYLAIYRKDQASKKKGDLLKESVTADVTLEEKDAADWYDTTVAADKQSVEENPFAYREKQEQYEDQLSDLPAFYAPEGFVRVQTIKIAMDEESAETFEANKTKMGELEAEYGALALNGGTGVRGAEIRAEHKALKEANAELGNALKARAESIREEALTSNMTFAALSKKYDESLDEKAAENGSLIYVAGEDTKFAPALKEAAAALGDGDISEIIEADGVYYVLRRVGAIPQGAVAFEDVKELAEKEALAAKKETAWTKASDEYAAAAAEAAVKYPAHYSEVGK